MNRDLVRKLHESLEKILATPESAKLFGPSLKVRVGRSVFDATSLTIKVEISEIIDGVAMTQEANAFTASAEYTGFAKEDLGKVVKLGGVDYKLIGAKWRTKYPILMERVNDKKVYRFRAESVRLALGYKPEVVS